MEIVRERRQVHHVGLEPQRRFSRITRARPPFVSQSRRRIVNGVTSNSANKVPLEQILSLECTIV